MTRNIEDELWGHIKPKVGIHPHRKTFKSTREAGVKAPREPIYRDLAAGMKTSQIARKHNCSERTVQTIRKEWAKKGGG